MEDVTSYNNLFQFLHLLWRMNQNKKEYSTIDKHLCLRSRHTDYHFCSFTTCYPGFHHLTHISWGNKQGKKRKEIYFPASGEAYPSTQLHIFIISKHYTSGLHVNYYSSSTIPSSILFWWLNPKSLFVNIMSWNMKIRVPGYQGTVFSWVSI